jgi:protoporphyrinogen oxidase
MSPSRRSALTGRARAALRALRSADADTAARVERLEAEHARTHQQLRTRMDALESLVEGLQDAVHRESIRYDALIDALQKKTEPSEIARALSDDARKRGL